MRISNCFMGLGLLSLVACGGGLSARTPPKAPAPSKEAPAQEDIVEEVTEQPTPARAVVVGRSPCEDVCADNFWECGCAFVLKAGGAVAPDCRAEFIQDHDTDCSGQNLPQCLQVVADRAGARGDTELVDITLRARQCLLNH